MELVDTRDLKSLGKFYRAGSSPALGTKLFFKFHCFILRAISSAWLERLRDMQEVTGSTPVSPTIEILSYHILQVRSTLHNEGSVVLPLETLKTIHLNMNISYQATNKWR